LLSGYDNAVLLNPRRENFPIHDPSAAREQIKWEFHALNNCDIFSIWFSRGPSVQPICMYELGRHLALCGRNRIVIDVEPGYKREQDVRIQVELVHKNLAISDNLQQHAQNIVEKLNLLHVYRNFLRDC